MSLLYLAILACEIGFWIVLGLALLARYGLRRPLLGRRLLFTLPLIDLALLGFTILDLRAGTTATFAHGLAAAYIGFTIGFGGLIIDWADRHVAHRLAGTPAPATPPQLGVQALVYDLKLWLRCLIAWAIALGLIALAIGLVDDPTKTAPLLLWFRIGLGGTLLWFVFGPLWSLVFRSWRRAPRG